ncbi:MAG: ABC transporter transmembrane domain-containing protein [Hydrogenophaga sp.]|nr:ABC transporter transmembrane domain-containing protein [Hydrogenophaga sp.]
MDISHQAEAQSSDLKHTLALLLARVATLQGQSVPWHRFSMVASTADGVDLSDLSPDSQAIELWRSRFSTGEAFRASWPLTAGMTPALWIGADPNAVLPVPGMLVIRGVLSSGALNCLDVQGHSHEIPAAMAERGQLVVLRSDETVSADRDETRLVTEGRSSSRRMTARQWFNHAIRKRWQVFSEGAIATLTLNVIALGSSFYSMQVYDRVLPSQGYQTLWVLTFGVGMAIVLELVMRQVRSRLVDRACKAIDEELSSVFFGQALAIRMDQRPRTVGTFAAQIRHFEMVRNFMTSTTLFVIADAPFALFFVGVIALVAGPVALVPLAAIPLSIIAGMAFRKKLARLTEVHMEESNRKNGLLIEAIDGIESVKAAGAEWKMQDRWRKLTRVLAEDEIAIRDLTGLSSNLTQTLQQLSYVGLVAAGALAIGAGQLTMGGLIACTIISGRALGMVFKTPCSPRWFEGPSRGTIAS